jgi:peptidoglycan/xylan/chitin deacetylase (PgdA/CDA1 family)
MMHRFSAATLEAMPELIRAIKDQGYPCITGSELLAHRS